MKREKRDTIKKNEKRRKRGQIDKIKSFFVYNVPLFF